MVTILYNNKCYVVVVFLPVTYVLHQLRLATDKLNLWKTNCGKRGYCGRCPCVMNLCSASLNFCLLSFAWTYLGVFVYAFGVCVSFGLAFDHVFKMEASLLLTAIYFPGREN